MVHVHGKQVAARAAMIAQVSPQRALIVPIDVGKHTAMTLVADAAGEQLVAPFTFRLDRQGLAEVVSQVERVVADRGATAVRVGVEAAGHYHRPVVASGLLPQTWEVIELNPGHVTEQRRVLGKRGVKTDQIDLVAMFDLLVAGRGQPAGRREHELLELRAWVGLRHRRVAAAIALKNQLLGQMDRTFPGAGACLSSSLLTTKVGRLVLAEFSDPARLARLGVDRFCRFAANRDVIVQRRVAQRFVAAAKQACPPAEAAMAQQLLAGDLSLLAELERQIEHADTELQQLLPATPFQVLTTTPGWSIVRAARYGAAVGDPGRWPSARQLYRAAGLTPKLHESAGSRYDGKICREGSVKLRGALLELGMGLWMCDPATSTRVAQLKARGKPSGIIACALANRANRIAFAMVRHQAPYQPQRWSH